MYRTNTRETYNDGTLVILASAGLRDASTDYRMTARWPEECAIAVLLPDRSVGGYRFVASEGETKRYPYLHKHLGSLLSFYLVLVALRRSVYALSDVDATFALAPHRHARLCLLSGFLGGNRLSRLTDPVWEWQRTEAFYENRLSTAEALPGADPGW